METEDRQTVKEIHRQIDKQTAFVSENQCVLSKVRITFYTRNATLLCALSVSVALPEVKIFLLVSSSFPFSFVLMRFFLQVDETIGVPLVRFEFETLDFRSQCIKQYSITRGRISSLYFGYMPQRTFGLQKRRRRDDNMYVLKVIKTQLPSTAQCSVSQIQFYGTKCAAKFCKCAVKF